MSTPGGKVLYPPFVMDFMGNALAELSVDADGIGAGTPPDVGKHLDDIMTTAFGETNPISSAVAYAPDNDLLSIQNTIDKYGDIIQGMDETATWEDMLSVALDHVEELLPSDTDADADITAFSAIQDTELARAYNRISIQFQDTNSVISTTFPSGLAMLEVDKSNQLSKYQAARRLDLSNQRSDALLKSIDQMARVLSWRLSSTATSAQLQSGKGGMAITSKSSQLRQDIEYNTKEIMWDFEVMKTGINIMGTLAGVPTVPVGLTQEQQALSGLANFAQFAIPIVTLLL